MLVLSAPGSTTSAAVLVPSGRHYTHCSGRRSHSSNTDCRRRRLARSSLSGPMTSASWMMFRGRRHSTRPVLERPCDILNYDLSNVPTIAGLKLAPTATRHPYSPFLVAHIDATVMMGHSGIFRDALARFLVDYTAITEGKRILARYYDAKKCASPTPDYR